MTNKNLDTILKSLGDFDPQVKPNWEGFLAENEAQLKPAGKTPVAETGKTTIYHTGLRYAGIVAVAAIGLFIGWYFMDTTPDAGQTNEMPEAIQVETAKEQPLESESVTNEKAQIVNPEFNQTIITDQPGINQPVQLDVNDFGSQDVPELRVMDNQAEMFEIQDPSQNSTVIIKDTVYVKKKIFVTDTIRRK
jgi:hypothetical protein